MQLAEQHKKGLILVYILKTEKQVAETFLGNL